MAAAPRKRALLIERPNRLRELALPGADATPGQFHPDRLLAAQMAVERVARTYPTGQAVFDLHDLEACYAKVRETMPDCLEPLRALSLQAREIGGIAATLGYPLLGQFAKSLHDMTDAMTRYSDREDLMVRAHIDAIRAVVRDRIAGDGGAVGAELGRTLGLAISRLLRRPG